VQYARAPVILLVVGNILNIVLDVWLWLGAVNSLEEATTLIRTPAGFDHDGYKILCKPLLSGNYEITELDPANDQRAS
ncbi:hypothetical protein ACUN9W_18710, partial [Escherichia coli]